MWREVDVDFCVCVAEVIGEKGRVLSDPERHLWIVSLLERLRLSWLDHWVGEVDLEQTLDGGRSRLEPFRDELFGSCVFAESTCVGSWDEGA